MCEPNEQLKDENVLHEEITYVIDVMDDKILDLVWSRIISIETPPMHGWVIYREEYSQTRRPDISKESHHIKRTIPLTDAIAARALFHGLKVHLAP